MEHTTFYKFKEINDNTISSLENKYFYFSDFTQLNDKLDGYIPNDYEFSLAKIAKWTKEHNCPFNEKIVKSFRSEKFRSYMDEKNDEERMLYGTFCVTTSWQNNHLWKKYAKEYSGVCFGYKCSFTHNSYVIEVTDQNKNSLVFKDGEKRYITFLRMKYDRIKLSKYSIVDKNKEAVKEGFLAKTPKWAAEKEYRSYIIDDDKLNNTNTYDKHIYYEKGVLSEIYFGINTPQDMIDKIKEIVSKNYSDEDIKFYVVRKTRGTVKRKEI